MSRKLTALQIRLLLWSSKGDGIAFYAEEKARVARLKGLGLIRVEVVPYRGFAEFENVVANHPTAFITESGLAELRRIGEMK